MTLRGGLEIGGERCHHKDKRELEALHTISSSDEGALL